MPSNLSGKYLEDLEEQLVSWASEYMLEMEKALTEVYPYGSVPLSPDDQIGRFIEMQGPDYQMLVAKLNEKYRGFPDAYDRVNKDLASFLSDMITKAAMVQT